MDEIWTVEYLNNLKRPQLQKLCKDNGLKASGKNNELIDRLLEFRQIDNKSEPHVEGSNEVMELTSKLNEDVQEESDFKQGELYVVSTPSKSNEPKASPMNKPPAKLEHLNIDISKASLTPEKRSRTKSVSEKVMEELAERTEQLLKVAPTSQHKQLQRSKSFANIKLDKQSKFDNVHHKQFNRMESIATHYAAKRTNLPVRKQVSMPKLKKDVQTTTKPIVTSKPRFPEDKRKSILQKMNPFDKQETKENIVNNKKKFDLAASLSRPLGYKPYKGKIKSSYFISSTHEANTESLTKEKSFRNQIKKKLSLGGGNKTK